MDILLIVIVTLAIAALITPLVRAFFKGGAKPNMLKKQLCSFGVVALMAVLLPVVVGAAATTPETTAAVVSDGSAGMAYLGAALVTGLACIGAGIAVAAAAPAAIGAFSENENAFGKSLIFVALGEGVAIYGLLISILILNKV